MANEQNNQNVKIPKKEKKKSSTSVRLPSARKSIKRQRHMAQGKAEWNGMWELITVGIVILLILFILFGGINQRKFVKTASEWSQTIGQKVQQILNPDDVMVTDDGVYVDPNGDGNPGI